MATILELAEFSDAAYGSKYFDGWTTLASSDELKPAFANDGYFGQAYQNQGTGEIVIANRGTRPTSLKDLLSDLQLTLHEKSAVQQDAAEYALMIANDSRYIGCPIVETGHSLGGNEAQAATVALTENGNTVSAVTFNSPGIGGYPIFPSNYHVLNYYNQGDAIHLAGGAHLGTSEMLPVGPDTSKLLYGLPAALGLGPIGVGALAAAAIYDLLGPAHSMVTTLSYLRAQNPDLGHTVWSSAGIGSPPAPFTVPTVSLTYSENSFKLSDANIGSATFSLDDNGSQSTTWTNADGSDITSIINADGSRNATITQPDGTTSTSSDDGQGSISTLSYDSTGREVNGDWKNSDGSCGLVTTIKSNYSDNFDYSSITINASGNIFLTSKRDVSNNPLAGNNTSIINPERSGSGISHYLDGSVAAEWSLNVDGSASGVSHNNDGSLAYRWAINVDGSITDTSYGENGIISATGIINADGSGIGASYDPNGNLGRTWVDDANGTRLVTSYNLNGTYASWTEQKSPHLSSLNSSGTGPCEFGRMDISDGSAIRFVSNAISKFAISYAPDGSISSIDVRNIDWSTTSATYSSSGSIISAASGSLGGSRSSARYNDDGSLGAISTGYSNGTTNRESDFYAGRLVSTSATDQDGAKTTKFYYADGSTSRESVLKDDGSSTSESFNSDGTLERVVIVNADWSSIATVYSLDGSIKTTTYSPDGTQLESYGSDFDGGSYDWHYKPDGTYFGYSITGDSTFIINEDGSGGLTTYTTDGGYSYKANGSNNVTSYRADGGLHSTYIVNADGSSNNISYYSDGAVEFTQSSSVEGIAFKSYRPDGSIWGYKNLDGSFGGIAYLPDGSYTKYDYNADRSGTVSDYDSNGIFFRQSTINIDGTTSRQSFYSQDGVLSQQYDFNADGSPISSINYYADGSVSFAIYFHVVGGASFYTNDGQGNTTTVDYDASWTKSSDSWTKADGSSAIDTFNMDGSSSGTSINLDGSYSGYTNDGQGDITTTNYDASGSKLSDNWIKADGSSGIDTFNMDGSSSGTSNSLDGSHSSYTNDGNGTIVTKNYDANGIELGFSIANVDGNGNTITQNYDVSGVELGYSVSIDNLHGNSGLLTITNYETNGLKLSDSWTKIDGSTGTDIFNLDESSSGTGINQDGSYSNYVNDGQGNVITQYFGAYGYLNGEAWTQADGSRGSDIYNVDGSNSRTTYSLDGSYSTTFNDTNGGQIFVNYSAAGSKLNDTWTKIDGTFGNDTFNADGTSTGRAQTSDGSYSLYTGDGLGTVFITNFDATGAQLGHSVAITDAENTTTTTKYGINNNELGYAISTNDGSGDVFTTDYDVSGKSIGDSWSQPGGVYGSDIFNADGTTENKVTRPLKFGGTHSTDTINALDGSYQQTWSSSNGSYGSVSYNAVTGEEIGTDVEPAGDYTSTYDSTQNTGGVIGASEIKTVYAFTDGSWQTNDIFTNPDFSQIRSWSLSDGSGGSMETNSSGAMVGSSWAQANGDQGVDAGVNHLLIAGSANESLAATSGNTILIGAGGNDSLTTGNGNNIIAFNAGNGQEVVDAAAGQNNTVSLGGTFAYADLALQKNGSDLVLDVGSEGITFKNWYAGSANVAVLQVVTSAMSDYSPGSGSALSGAQVETFDFQGLVQAFDQVRSANPGISAWSVSDALLNVHLSASDSAAIGGDLTFEYGARGSLAGMSVASAQTTMTGSGFAANAQSFSSWSSVHSGAAQLK